MDKNLVSGMTMQQLHALILYTKDVLAYDEWHARYGFLYPVYGRNGAIELRYA